MKADWLQLPDTAGDIPPRRHHRRLTLAVLLGAAFLAGSIAGRALASTPRPDAQELIPAPHPSDPPALVVGRQPEPERRTRSSNLPTVTARPWPAAGVLSGRTNAVLVSGIASWGYGWVGVVTRLPRGTAITVCGALGCWSGRSTGYGPAVWTHRIADLSRSVFAAICGAPSKGLCRVTLTW
jgi:hypothetical protein